MLVDTCVCMCSRAEVQSPSQGEHDALSQGTTCWSLLDPSALWVLGIDSGPRTRWQALLLSTPSHQPFP